MAIKYQLSVIAKGDVGDATRALGKLEKRAGSVSKRVRASAMQVSKGFALASAAAVAGTAVYLKQGAQSLARIERIGAQTNAVIKSTGGAANVTRQHIDDMAGRIEALTGVEAESVTQGQNMLLTFTNIRNGVGRGNQVFDQATNILADMSVALGTDMSKQAVQLGKALNDPVKGVTALTKVGVTFTAGQKKQIKSLVDQGKSMDAQKIILRELTKEFGGSAKAFGKTTSGQVAKAGHAWGTLQETLSAKLMPTILRLAQAGIRGFTWLDEATRKGGVLRPALQGVWTGLTRLKGALVSAGQAFAQGFRGPAGGSAMTAREVSAALGQAAARAGELAQKYLPPLAQKLGEVTRFLFDHRATLMKVVIAAALLDKAVKAGRLTMSAYGVVARTTTKIVELYRLAKWKLAATEIKAKAATIASTIATKAQTIASKAAAAGQWLLNAALTANPIGLIVVGIAALVAAFVIAYKRSDKFKKIVDAVWGGIKRLAAKVWEFKEYLVLLAGPAGGLVLAYRKSDKFRAVVQGLWSMIRKLTAKLWDMKEYLLLLAGPAGAFVLAYRKSDAFRSVVGKVVGKLRDVASTIKDTVLGTIKQLRDAFSKLLEKLEPAAKLLGNVGGALKGIGKVGSAAAGAIGDADIPGGFPAPAGLLKKWGLQPKMANAVGMGLAQGLTVTSGIRPGAITAAGLPSDHGDGSAVDLAGPPPAMAQAYRLAGMLPNLKQRLYSPLDGWSKDHFDHVHIALHAIGGRLASSIHGLASRGGRVGQPTIIDVAGEAGDEQVVPLSPRYRKHGLRNLHEAADALGATVVEHATGKGKKGAKKKVKAKTLAERFEALQAMLGLPAGKLDLALATAEGTAKAEDDVKAITALQTNAQRQVARINAFIKASGKKLKGALKSDVLAAKADAIRSAQSFATQLEDIRTTSADAVRAKADDVYQTSVGDMDLDLAEAERGGTSFDAREKQAGVVQRQATAAMARYEELKKRLSSKGLSAAAKAETKAGMAEALRAFSGFTQQAAELMPTLEEKILAGVATVREAFSFKGASQDLAMARAEMTDGLDDDVSVLTDMGNTARQEYDSLAATIAAGGLGAAAQAELEGAAADALRRSKGYFDQIKDMATTAVLAVANTLKQNLAWRNSIIDLQLAQAEMTETTEDDLAAYGQLAQSAREEYDGLLAQLQQGGLSEAARAELSDSAAEALRRYKQFQDKIKETSEQTARALTDDERRGLSRLGLNVAPGTTQIEVKQYYTSEPNAFAASNGVKWALQAAFT